MDIISYIGVGREKMDAALRRIWKDRLLPFSKRYCRLTEVRYGKKR